MYANYKIGGKKKKNETCFARDFLPGNERLAPQLLPAAPYRWKAAQAVVRISFINYQSRVNEKND